MEANQNKDVLLENKMSDDNGPMTAAAETMTPAATMSDANEPMAPDAPDEAIVTVAAPEPTPVAAPVAAPAPAPVPAPVPESAPAPVPAEEMPKEIIPPANETKKRRPTNPRGKTQKKNSKGRRTMRGKTNRKRSKIVSKPIVLSKKGKNKVVDLIMKTIESGNEEMPMLNKFGGNQRHIYFGEMKKQNLDLIRKMAKLASHTEGRSTLLKIAKFCKKEFPGLNQMDLLTIPAFCAMAYKNPRVLNQATAFIIAKYLEKKGRKDEETVGMNKYTFTGIHATVDALVKSVIHHLLSHKKPATLKLTMHGGMKIDFKFVKATFALFASFAFMQMLRSWDTQASQTMKETLEESVVGRAFSAGTTAYERLQMCRGGLEYEPEVQLLDELNKLMGGSSIETYKEIASLHSCLSNPESVDQMMNEFIKMGTKVQGTEKGAEEGTEEGTEEATEEGAEKGTAEPSNALVVANSGEVSTITLPSGMIPQEVQDQLVPQQLEEIDAAVQETLKGLLGPFLDAADVIKQRETLEQLHRTSPAEIEKKIRDALLELEKRYNGEEPATNQPTMEEVEVEINTLLPKTTKPAEAKVEVKKETSSMWRILELAGAVATNMYNAPNPAIKRVFFSYDMAKSINTMLQNWITKQMGEMEKSTIDVKVLFQTFSVEVSNLIAQSIAAYRWNAWLRAMEWEFLIHSIVYFIYVFNLIRGSTTRRVQRGNPPLAIANANGRTRRAIRDDGSSPMRELEYMREDEQPLQLPLPPLPPPPPPYLGPNDPLNRDLPPMDDREVAEQLLGLRGR
jgi:hypothetical protein